VCGQYFSVANVVALQRPLYLSGVTRSWWRSYRWPRCSAVLLCSSAVLLQRATQQLSAASYISTCLLFPATDLLDVAYCHTCPQSSTVRSFIHSLTYRPSSPLLHVDLSLLARAFCDQQRCVCCLYILPCRCYSQCAPRRVLPFYLKFWVKVTAGAKSLIFLSIFARSASAVTPS